MSDEKELLVLIDGHAILHRAYHALPPLTTRNGEPVNAVYGFALMLLKIFDELKPKCLAASFDTSKSAFRTGEFIGYKAQRPSMDAELIAQQPKVYELVKAFNIPIYTVEGYEADDIIGTLAKQATELNQETGTMNQESGTRNHGRDKKKHSSLFNIHGSNLEVLIVTGDKDFMQLVDDKIKLFMPTRGLSEAKIINREAVREIMELPPEKMIDYKALVGDASDNYPGVPGIGPKTAVELLNKYSTLSLLYERFENDDEISAGVKAKLREGKESAFLSQKLATIMTDVPIKINLKDCLSADYDKEKVSDFFKQLGFRSLVGRINPALSRQPAGLRGAGGGQQSLF